MTPLDDDKDPKWVWPHPADFGTIVLAGVFLAATVATIIFLFSSPEPIRDMFEKHPSAAAEPNEVTITLPQKK
jgi:hypothetical protein